MKRLPKILMTILCIVTLVLFSSSTCKADTDSVNSATASASGANLTVSGTASGYAVAITIKDSSGNTVDFMTVAVDSSGTYSATFTMTSSGSYTASVQGYDEAGAETSGTAKTTSAVTVIVPNTSSNNANEETSKESNEEETSTSTNEISGLEDTTTESVSDNSDNGDGASTGDNSLVYIYCMLLLACGVAVVLNKKFA